RPYHLLTLSARSEDALKVLAGRYGATVAEASETELGDICHTANVGRIGLNHRLAVYGDASKKLEQALIAFAQGQHAGKQLLVSSAPAGAPPVVWLFTGQGSQYPDMGRQLYETQPVFRQTLDRCAELLAPYLDVPLLSLLYPNSASNLAADDRLHQTAYTQPALFALEYALAMLWRSWGIEPAAVLGHSVGEYVAACVAGVMSLEDGLKLIARRGRLMQSLPENGTMAAVFADEATVAEAIAPYGETVAIATLNGPQNTVIAGLKTFVEEVLEGLEAKGVRATRLTVSHAFHSPLMDPILNLFEHTARQITFKAPTLPFVSNVTGQLFAPGQVPDAAYWRQHARSAVRFAEGLATLQAQGYTHFLEIGPHPVLSGMGKRCFPADSVTWLPSLRQGQEDWPVMLQSLSQLYLDGVPVDWAAFDRPYRRRRRSLPTYPFQRQRYWIDLPTVIPPSSQSIRTAPEALENSVYQLAWHPQPVSPLLDEAGGFQERGITLVFSDSTGLGDALTAEIRASGSEAIQVFAGDDFRALAPSQYQVNPERQEDFHQLIEALESSNSQVGQVLYLWSLDQQGTAQPNSGETACAGLLALLKAVVNAPSKALPQLWLVTQAAQFIPGQTLSLNPLQAALWGMGRTLRWEHPELWGGLIDVDAPPNHREALAQALLAHIK
ncbi:MAG TPA: acyltransferase domain-containing protein, partial [Trichocoleus sp.]